MSPQSLPAPQAVPRVDPPTWDFADRLRKIRIQIAGAGQREFGASLGLSQAAYGAYETGRHRPRDILAFAKRIELLTGVPATWTLGLDDAQATNEASPGTGSVTEGKGTTKGS